MNEPFSARRGPFSIQEPTLGGLEQADAEEIGEPILPATGIPPEPTIEQMRAVQGTLSFLTALITFYGDLIERDAPADAGSASGKGANLQ
jgi:hypothetical protein